MQHKWLYLQVQYQPTNIRNDCSIVITINFQCNAIKPNAPTWSSIQCGSCNGEEVKKRWQTISRLMCL